MPITATALLRFWDMACSFVYGAPHQLGTFDCVHCINQPWLTTIDWPVNAFDPNEAKNNAVCATSSTVVNSPSTVSLSITFLITSCSEMPSSFACSGICLSTRGARTKPGQMTLARTPRAAPSLATTLASPISPCLAVTYGALSTDASLEWTEST